MLELRVHPVMIFQAKIRIVGLGSCVKSILLRSLFQTVPEFKKRFSCSTQLRLKFILLINVLKYANYCWHFDINKQDKLLVF